MATSSNSMSLVGAGLSRTASDLPVTPCMMIVVQTGLIAPIQTVTRSQRVPTAVSECRYSVLGTMLDLSQRLRGCVEPLLRCLIECKAHLAAHPRVIVVKPVELLKTHLRGIDQPAVDRGKRQRFETVHRLFRAGDLDAGDEFEVFDADAVGIRLVIAGLVGQDHAALQRRGAEFRDPRRAFMHREIVADPMAGAVLEIEP